MLVHVNIIVALAMLAFGSDSRVEALTQILSEIYTSSRYRRAHLTIAWIAGSAERVWVRFYSDRTVAFYGDAATVGRFLDALQGKRDPETAMELRFGSFAELERYAFDYEPIVGECCDRCEWFEAVHSAYLDEQAARG